MRSQTVIKPNDFVSLDVLRGIASLYVCIAHCRGVLWMGLNKFLLLHPVKTWHITEYIIAALASLTKLSGEAVIFFFVLSGFSIAHSLSFQHSIKLFYLKRFIRLYPTYLLGIVFSVAVIGILYVYSREIFFGGQYDTLLFARIKASESLLNWKVWVWAVFYNPDLNTILTPYWSLVYEVLFYLAAPLIFKNSRLYYILSVVFFVAGFLFEITGVGTMASDSILYTYVFHYNIYFMIGIYTYRNYDKVFDKLKAVMKYWKLTVGIAFVLMIILESLIGERGRVSFLVAALTCVLCIQYFIRGKIAPRFLNWIGGFSYTLYVFHFATITLCAAFLFTVLKLAPIPDIENGFIWLAGIPVCIGIAWCANFLAERPSKLVLMRLRKR